MSEMVTSAGVPEVSIENGGTATESLPASFSGKWEDMAKDMAAIQQEIQPAQPEASNDQPPAAVTPPVESKVEVVVPAPVVEQVKPVTVPEKFQTPEGTLDEEKILKSYAEAEKALHRAQNAQKQATQPPMAQTKAAPPTPQNIQLSPFEAQVAQDIFSGGGFTEQQAISMARVQVKLQEARHQADVAATFTKVAQFEESLNEQARQKELEVLAKNQSTNWVLTPQGQQEMVKARTENPWLNNSPEPWKAAAMFILGQRTLQGQSASVVPNPTGGQQSAPQLPVTPAQKAPPPVSLNSPAEVESYLNTLTPAQEAEFWKKNGLKWDGGNKPYKGI